MYPCHVNDSEFANALVDAFLEICRDKTNDTSSLQVAISDPNQDHLSIMSSSLLGAIPYGANYFPDARPGSIFTT